MNQPKLTNGIRIALVVGLLVGLSALPSGPAQATTTAHPDLTVTKDGLGLGTVTSNPAGIDCGTDCTHPYPLEEWENCIPNPHVPSGEICSTEFRPQRVTLTANAAAGSRFTGWSGGGCSSTEPCTVVMNGDKTVTATFVDFLEPNIGSIWPSFGSHRSDTSITISAVDNIGIWYVSAFLYQGGNQVGYLGTDASPPYSLAIANRQVFDELSDGPVEIRAYARDTSGNWSDEAVSNFIVDDTGPAIDFSAGPLDGSTSPDPSVTFEFSVDDEWSEVYTVQCALHGASVAGEFGPCSGGETSHSAEVGPGGADNGRYIFSARAVDSVGNVSTQTRSWTVTRMPTKLTLRLDKKRRNMTAGGVLREDWQDERDRIGDASVTSTLFKKRKGRFVKLSSKSDVTDASGRYATTFRRPQTGRCKLTSKYRVNELRRGSKKTKRFKC